MRPLDKAELRQLAEDQLRILNGNPKPGRNPDFLSGELGKRLLDLGVEVDGGEAFCRLYGHSAFINSDEFLEAARRVEELDALCSGILSQWRFYSHWNNAGLSDGMREWFVATLTHLARMAAEQCLESKLIEYGNAFDDQFPRMLCRGATNDEIIAIIDECLKTGEPYEPSIEPGCKY